MTKRQLLIVMTLLLALQAVASSAAMHHIGEADCVLAECSHHHSGEEADLPHDDKHSVSDCHHCGHCYRVPNLAVLVDYETLDLRKFLTPLPAYEEESFPVVLSVLLRPPKLIS